MSATTGTPAEIVSLEVTSSGSFSLSSNLDAFRASIRSVLDAVNMDPKTDEEFGQAKDDAKRLRGACDSIKSAKEEVLAQASEVHALLQSLDEADAEIRAAALNLENTVKAKETEIKETMISDALDRLECVPRLRRNYAEKVRTSIKGKRTIASIEKALKITVVTINALIRKSRELVEQFVAEHGPDLVPDAEDLEVRNPDQVEGELRRRIEKKRADEATAKLREKEAAEKKAKAETLAAAQKAAKPAPAQAPTESAQATPADTEAAKPTDQAEDEELAAFRKSLIEAFGPVKAAKEALVHPSNVERAAAFSQAVNSAFNAYLKP